jgi:hypothetical protein
VTFKDLRQKLTKLQDYPSTVDKDKLKIFKSKPFWIWDKSVHIHEYDKTNGYCCFNHIVKCPTKDGVEYPLFDYEKLLYDNLTYQSEDKKNSFKDKHLWIKKATGLGITEFMLRFMAWLCVKDNSYRNSQMCIVTGPNQDIAIKLIKRLKGIFEAKLGITFDNKETVIELNGCSIEAYPSNHLDSYRALTNPKFILLDEADMFRKGEQEDVRHVSERYIGKSNPYIVKVSTPNAPNGLFEKIEKEPEETCIYRRLLLDYTYGLDRIYTREVIEKVKKSPSFEREYNLKYLGLIGNTFHQKDIDRSILLGDSYSPDLVSIGQSDMVLGIDSGFGSSAFGIVLLEFINGQIHVKLADEFEHVRYEDAVSKIKYILRRMNQWSINQESLESVKIYVDASAPEFIRSLKVIVGEDDSPSYIKEQLDYCRKYDLNIADYMTVIPVSFNPEAKNMLIHIKELLEYEARPLIGINSRFDKLITALRTAVSDDQGKLDKESTSYDDVLDSFRLALRHFKIKNKNKDKNNEPIILYQNK